jgi:uncharacterized cupin superfamily protein
VSANSHSNISKPLNQQTY